MGTCLFKNILRDSQFAGLFTSICPNMITRTEMSSSLSFPWTRNFTTSKSLLNKSKQQQVDPRVTLIRYHMKHPLMPRPLRLSRNRALRHWTIARAWDIWQKKKRIQADLELQRKYHSIQFAMEVLRNLDDGSATDGLEGSRLYRIALEKKGIYSRGAIPIEYARLQVDTPGETPWDHTWKR